MFIYAIFIFVILFSIPSVLNGGTQKKVTQRVTKLPPNNNTLEAPRKLHEYVKRRYYYMKMRRSPKARYVTPPNYSKKVKVNLFGSDEGENYYEPYMSDGEWVFTREVQDFFYTWTQSVMMGTGSSPSSWLPITQRLSDTAHNYCPMIWKLYGKVCARRFNYYSWVFEYREFDDMCVMQDWNFMEQYKRPNWYVVHTGFCNYTEPWDYQAIVADELDKRVVSLFSYADLHALSTIPFPTPFDYVPPGQIKKTTKNIDLNP